MGSAQSDFRNLILSNEACIMNLLDFLLLKTSPLDINGHA